MTPLVTILIAQANEEIARTVETRVRVSAA
jgi:hypothetical protein